MKVGDLVILRETSWIDPQHWGKTCVIIEKSATPVETSINDAFANVYQTFIDMEYTIPWVRIETFTVMDGDGSFIQCVRNEDILFKEANVNEKK